MKQLKNLITKYIDFDDAEWVELIKYLDVRHYKKGEIILKEGDYCNYVGFVNKGHFSFYYLKDGVKYIRGFFFENNFISNYPSFLLENKSKFQIEAIVESSVISINRENLFLLNKEFPKIKELSNAVVESLYIEISDKFESFLIKTAEERYIDLLNNEPELSLKIPQYMMASYLGITPEGLSRIKKRIF